MDYNIYIHDKTKGSQYPTKPRKGGGINTTPKQEESSGGGSFSETVGTLKNIKNGSWATAGKIGIAIAVIKKAADIVVRTVETVESYHTRESGDYRFNTWWSNAKATWNIAWGTIQNPMGTVNTYMTSWHKDRIYAEKQTQQRLLLGDAEVNQKGRRM